MTEVTCGGGQGGWETGSKGGGRCTGGGRRGVGSGIPKGAGSGRRRVKLHNIVQYFAIEQRGGSQ